MGRSIPPAIRAAQKVAAMALFVLDKSGEIGLLFVCDQRVRRYSLRFRSLSIPERAEPLPAALGPRPISPECLAQRSIRLTSYQKTNPVYRA